MTQQKQYQYNPLDLLACEIRLVKILPGEYTTKLCCETSMDFLDKKPTYKALSYKWGSSDSCEILLDGLSHKICKNLHRFLIQARERNDILSGLLWIDALCIDQVNNQEKKHQVDLMWSIYETAKQVVVWLGPAYEGSDRALRMLKKLSQHGWSLKKPSKFWKSPEGIGAQQLCNRKYWTRVWIFQELYFAHDILFLCGSQTISLEALKQVFVQASTLKHSGIDDPVASKYRIAVCDSYANKMMQQLQHLQEPSARPTLWNLLKRTHHLNCTNSRDKIYGLLGIAGESCAEIKPDYTRDPVTLLHLVLRNEHRQQPPISLQGVADQVEQLANMMGIDSKAIFSWEIETPQKLSVTSSEIQPFLWDGQCNLWWALAHEHHAVLKIHRQSIADTMYKATATGSVMVITVIIAIDLMAKERAFDVPNAFKIAAELGREDVVRLLCAKYPTYINQSNHCGKICFSYAAEEGHSRVVKFLAEFSEVDVNHVDPQTGRSPLMQAARLGHYGVCKVLCEIPRTDVNCTDSRGLCAALHAVKTGHADIFEHIFDTRRPEMEGVTLSKDILKQHARDGNFTAVVRNMLEINTLNVHKQLAGSNQPSLMCEAVMSWQDQVVGLCSAKSNFTAPESVFQHKWLDRVYYHIQLVEAVRLEYYENMRSAIEYDKTDAQTPSEGDFCRAIDPIFRLYECLAAALLGIHSGTPPKGMETHLIAKWLREAEMVDRSINLAFLSQMEQSVKKTNLGTDPRYAPPVLCSLTSGYKAFIKLAICIQVARHRVLGDVY